MDFSFEQEGARLFQRLLSAAWEGAPKSQGEARRLMLDAGTRPCWYSVYSTTTTPRGTNEEVALSPAWTATAEGEGERSIVLKVQGPTGGIHTSFVSGVTTEMVTAVKAAATVAGGPGAVAKSSLKKPKTGMCVNLPLSNLLRIVFTSLRTDEEVAIDVAGIKGLLDETVNETQLITARGNSNAKGKLRRAVKKQGRQVLKKQKQEQVREERVKQEEERKQVQEQEKTAKSRGLKRVWWKPRNPGNGLSQMKHK